MRLSLIFCQTGRSEMIESPARFNTAYDYITLESYFDRSYYARTLPPVPRNCPTPMGVVGWY